MNAKPWDYIDPNKRASKEVYKSRINICEGCEHLIPLLKQCFKCGCLMEIKTRITDAQCPIGKW